MSATVLGDIVERRPSSSASKRSELPGSSNLAFVDVPTSTGFPKAHHRLQGLSTFALRRARANEEPMQSSDSVPTIRAGSSKSGNGIARKEFTTQDMTLSDVRAPGNDEGKVEQEHPQRESGIVEQRTSPEAASTMMTGKTNARDEVEWRRNMEKENDKLLENMNDKQRSQKRDELIEQLGPDVLDLMSRIQGRRGKELYKMSDTGAPSRPRSAMAHHSRTGTEDSTSASKAQRHLRFSEGPDQVFVYESQPPSPKRIFALLPAPPSSTEAASAAENPLEVTGSKKSDAEASTDPPPSKATQKDEHTPDTIRKKYFPNEPPPSQNPTLAWLTKSDKDDGDHVQPSPSTRYDLQGRVIPKHLVSRLPSHLGLHHHGNDPEEAGYTLDELLMLSRSTLPAQRAASLQVLARLLARMKRSLTNAPHVESRQEGRGDEEEKANTKAVTEIFQKCLIVGIEAFGERASATVRMAGLDAIWAGLVPDRDAVTKSRFTIAEDQAQLETLPLSYFYSATVFNFTRTTLNSPSLVKLFEVLTSLVTLSVKVAEELVEVSGLLDGAVRSIPSYGSSAYSIDTSNIPAYLAMLEFMKSLASVSRRCARSLIPGVSDSFLRYIVTLPSLEEKSSNNSSLGVVSYILDLYALLGRYGMGASIALTGHEYFQRLASFVTQEIPLDSSESRSLITSWLGLMETWIVCAIDPHQTSPEHDILWSQVVAWQWPDALLTLRKRFLEADTENMSANWAGWWRAWAAWLQGCRVNEPNQGGEELSGWRGRMEDGWANGGKEQVMFEEASAVLWTLDLSELPKTKLLGSVQIIHAVFLLVEAQEFPTPLIPATAIVKNVISDNNWRYISSIYDSSHLRVWTNMLTYLVRFSHQTGHPIDLHYRVIHVLIPGDEMLAARLISDILADTLKPDASEGLDLPEDFWTAAGGPVKILLPLYQYALWPQEDLFIAPFVPRSSGLKMATTLHRPLNSPGVTTPSGGVVGIRLPQERLGDWIISALDILLRSGSTHSRLFRSLPADWTASEAEVVRSLLTLIVRRRVPLSRSQLHFTCMKVFMLEHDQATLENGEEVYQNPIVGRLMLQVLQPLRLSWSSKRDASQRWMSNDSLRLDVVAKAFLGPEQPFYQFYSDFLGLYDSSSFGHELFGTLTLPPTSQLYPKDYRKLFWGDYGHILRSIQVDVPDVLATQEDLKHWLWPVEGRRDGEMLSFYVKALVRGHVVGFLRFIAVHQVANCLWPDLAEPNEQTTASKLLRAVLTSTDESLLGDLLYYQQSQEDGIPTFPPRCYESLPSLGASRLEWASSLAGETVRNRFPRV